MRSSTFHLTIVSLLILGSGVTGCHPYESTVDSKSPYTWRFAIEESVGSVQHAYAMEFKRLIEERTANEVKVVVYPYGALGTSTQITEQLNLGALQLAMASPGALGKFIPETQAFLLHFLLPIDDEATRRVLKSPQLLSTFDGLYRERGLKLLSIIPEGEMVWTTRKEIREPRDFRGVRMRVMTTPLLIAAYEAYGANPTPLPYAEVYSALQLNMIDAQVNPVFAIERQKFHEVTDWLIFPRHAHFVATVAANHRFYEELSSEHRTIVLDVIAQLHDYIFQKQLDFQTEMLINIIRDRQRRRNVLNLSGDFSTFIDALSPDREDELIHNNPYLKFTPALTESERNAFREASQQVHETFLRIGGSRAEEVLHLIQSLVDSVESQQ